MKFFVTGANGQLGRDVMKELIKRGHFVIGSDVQEASPFSFYQRLDITNKAEVDRVVFSVVPDAVIHCAAWTAVDDAEDEDKKALVERINVEGTKNIVEACKRANIKMMYISTDYVFGGGGVEPWKPDFKEYAPQNWYGKTKLDGELAVSDALKKFFIVRIAWVFGDGKNFIKTMLSLADKGCRELKVVDDQIGTPTYTVDLARLLADMIQTEKYGYYHATNEGGFISWADFAEEIFRQTGKDVRILRVTTAEYGLSKAKRPYNSRLDKSKLIERGFQPLPDWKSALQRYLQSIKTAKKD